MRFDLVDLRLFLHVVEAGSITRGAALAHLALPSASARLRGMEELCGVALLERGRRGVRPTAAGEAVARHASLVLTQMERLQGELREHLEGLRGQVRLLANTAAAREFLPQPLGTWLVRHPRVNIELKERRSSEIVKALAGGGAEIGIVSDAVDHGELDTRPFALDRLVLVAPRDSRWSRARRVAFETLLAEGFVGLEPASALQAYLEDQAGQAGATLAYRVRMQGVEGVCRLAGLGVGLGIVPEAAARRCRRAAGIALIRLSDPWATRRLLLCSRPPAELPRAARDLLTHLSEASAGA